MHPPGSLQLSQVQYAVGAPYRAAARHRNLISIASLLANRL